MISLVILLIYNRITTPSFFHLEVRDGYLFGNLVDMLHWAVPTAIIAMGMTLVIATNGVDLSVGATIAIVGAVASLMVTKGNPPIASVIAAALGIGILLGLWNGVLVAYGKLQPIVATLVLMVAGRGIAQIITDGTIVTFENPALAFFDGGHLFMLPFGVTLVAIAFLITALLTRKTALGLFIETVGDNPSAARASGINVRSVKLLVYMMTGLWAAVAGLVVVAQTKAADANTAGLNLELDAILAVVLGGTSLNGGRFNLAGSLVGAVLIQALTTTILSKGVPAEWNFVVKGAVVLAVCLVQSPEFRKSLRLRRAA